MSTVGLTKKTKEDKTALTDDVCLSIFTAADNLEIIIHTKEGEDNCGIQISLGESPGARNLISTNLSWTRQDACDAVYGILLTSLRKSRRLLKDSTKPNAYRYNPDQLPVSEMKNVLVLEKISQIRDELKKSNFIMTKHLFAN